MPRIQDIANLVFEIAAYYANDSADILVKRMSAKNLALQLEVAAVRERRMYISYNICQCYSIC